MKQLKLLSLMLAILMIPIMVSCGGDDEKGSGSSGDDLIIIAAGTWMCTQSVDTQNGNTYQGLMVGKEITISPNGTYVSTAPTFGFSGTYTVSGNKITAHSDAGSTFLINVTISGDRMTWEGTANNGVSFRYIFERESNDVPSEKAFTNEIIAGNFQWYVNSVGIKRGSSNSVKQGKTIRFYEDGTCEAFHSMETAWRLNNGRIETYYKKTGEPMYVYTLLSANSDEIMIRINGTLDDILEAEVVLIKKNIPTEDVTQDFTKEQLIAIFNASYSYCAEFEMAQIELEGIRTNPSTVHSITPNTNEVSNTWQSAYKAINAINVVLDRENDILSRFGGQDIRVMIAELRALRAFINYNLAILWGNVPLIKQVNIDGGYYIAQSSQSEVLMFAYDEINKVISNLPTSEGQNGRLHFNKDAGSMLIAELQMALGNKSEAAAYLNSINKTTYDTRSSTSTSLEKSFIWAVSPQQNSYCPVYTLMHNQLYLYEITGSTKNLILPSIDVNKDGIPDEDLESFWVASDQLDYGYWAALKRIGKAQEVTGCYNHELLMPIPYMDIINNPNLTQNPGY